MRFVYRNRKLALFGMFFLFGAMMILIKFTEFSPTCLFREETVQPGPMMVRDQVKHTSTSRIFFTFVFRANNHFPFMIYQKNASICYTYTLYTLMYTLIAFFCCCFDSILFILLFCRNLYSETTNTTIRTIDRCH